MVLLQRNGPLYPSLQEIAKEALCYIEFAFINLCWHRLRIVATLGELYYKWNNPPPFLVSPSSHNDDDDDLIIIHFTIPLLCHAIINLNYCH